MRLTGQPGNWGPYADWQGGIRLLRRAVDLGVNLIDTARSYGAGWNERLIAEALAPYPAHLVIATKGGIEKVAPGQVEVDARPQSLRRHVEDALSNLHTERIDLFQLHRPDPAVPLAESIGALQAMQAEGKLRWIGVSNVDLAQLQLARSIAVIVSVQNRCNQLDAPDDVVLDYCTREGLAYVTHGPLAAHAQRHGAPLAATGRSAPSALRRLLERAPNVAISPGTTSIAHLEENLRAWDAPA
jgi:aryl-alcohol dehydrogenase-like predicted oxidoreductase